MRIKMKELRKERGWSQQKLAEKLAMSIDYVKSIEIGRCTPSLPMARKIADLFGLKTIDEILEAS